jgi:hypothetical protein
MPEVLSNAVGTIGIGTTGADPGSGGTTLTLASGQGSRFPAVPAGSTMRIQVQNEIMIVTAHTAAADTMTVTRGGESTLAVAHPVGCAASVVLTKGSLDVLGVGSTLASPMTYGAAGDGTTDDSTAVQAALDSGRAVLIERPYLVGGLTLASGTTVYGGRGGKLLRKAASTYTMSINSGSGGSSDPTTNIARVSILGVVFDDNVAVNTFRQGDAQLNLNACSDVLVDGCTFLGFRSDAIYLGSSNTGSTERHNQRVKIVNSVFDGVNKDNRNAISVIDCDDLLVSGNTFRRCTRSDMPGAIDIEPNIGNTFGILRDLKIVNNRFDGIGGSAAIGTLMAGIGTFTTLPSGWLIAENTFRNLDATCLPVNLLFQAAATTSSARQNIQVINNQTFGARRLISIDGARGVRVAGNDVAGSPFAAVQIGSGYASVDVTIDRNEFYQCGSESGAIAPGAIALSNGTYIKIDGNNFIDCGLPVGDPSAPWGLCLVLAGSGTSSDFVDFTGTNSMRAGTRMTDVSYKSSGHTKGGNNTYVAPLHGSGGTALP